MTHRLGLVLSFFVLYEDLHTSSSLIFSAGVGERGVAGGVNGCVERCSGRVWGVFSKYQHLNYKKKNPQYVA